MDKIEELERARAAARGRMNRAEKVRQVTLAKLCRLNAEYHHAREEYRSLDRRIANEAIEELPPPRKGKGPRPEGIKSELDNLSADQIAMLKARIDQMKEQEQARQLGVEDEDEDEDE
jgi:chromosome segregation ATPase